MNKEEIILRLKAICYYIETHLKDNQKIFDEDDINTMNIAIQLAKNATDDELEISNTETLCDKCAFQFKECHCDCNNEFELK